MQKAHRLRCSCDATYEEKFRRAFDQHEVGSREECSRADYKKARAFIETAPPEIDKFQARPMTVVECYDEVMVVFI